MYLPLDVASMVPLVVSVSNSTEWNSFPYTTVTVLLVVTFSMEHSVLSAPIVTSPEVSW